MCPPIDTPTTSREHYNPNHFVGREKEVHAVRRKVEEGLAGFPITRPVVHLWGAPGIGKSWLLQHLEQHLPDEVLPGVKRGLLTARVDFNNFSFALKSAADVASLLDCLLIRADSEMLDGALQEALACFEQARNAFQASQTEKETADLLDKFNQYMLQLSGHYVLLFLLDSVERLDAESFFWLERELIAPLSRTDRMIFVIAGRKELPRWKEFVVRQRLEVWEIRGFSLSETQEQLAKYRVQEALSDIYPYTFGHPYANWVWARAWAEDAQPSSEKKRALITQVEAELLKDISLERERDILRTLCALRKFNVESARLLLGAIIDPEFGTVSDGYYLRLFETLEQSNLVYWSSEARGYTMSFPVRRILDLRIQVTDPERFRKRHDLVRELYEKRFEDRQADRAGQLLEILFHAARSIRGDLAENAAKTQICEALKPEILRILDARLTESHFDADSIDMLYHSLERDIEFHEEGEVFPAEIYDAVMMRVKEFRHALLSV